MNQTHLVPLSIVVGFMLVAGAIYFSETPFSLGMFQQQEGAAQGVQEAHKDPQRTNTDDRLVYGNPDAPTVIVEFSDYQCPFCSQLHPTLKKIVDESEGTIQWQYRHLPLPNHPFAQISAVVGECVGRLAGNDAFWEYTDYLFANQKAINNELITKAAVSQNIGTTELEQCVNGGDAVKVVATDLAAARALGGSGTPFSVILFEDGTTKPVTGALPYAQWVPLLNI